MAVYLRPYDREPLPNAGELYAAANLLSDHDFPLALIRAINGEALVRFGARTRKGRLLVRLILLWFDVETGVEHSAIGRRLPWWFWSKVLPTWRLSKRLQEARRIIKKRGW